MLLILYSLLNQKLKSLIVISCPLVAFLGDTENNDLKKYNQVIMLKIISA